MVKTVKPVRNDTPWPRHWVVSKEWTLPADIKLPRGSDRILVSRRHEVALKGHPSVWYLFDRHVYNPQVDREWIDAFAAHPHTHFTAFRPDEIIKVRAHVAPRKRKPVETVNTDERT